MYAGKQNLAAFDDTACTLQDNTLRHPYEHIGAGCNNAERVLQDNIC